MAKSWGDCTHNNMSCINLCFTTRIWEFSSVNLCKRNTFVLLITEQVALLQFAGTLSDGLGKTMDNRHQTEREYIRYHAATSGEHLVAGIHGLAHGEPWLQF